MKLLSPVIFAALFLLAMLSQTSAATSHPGVIVEKVFTNFAAQKAGIEPGDVLSRWSRGDRRGTIESPFALSQVEIEEAPRGPVRIEGWRGDQPKTWVTGPEGWGVSTRPVLDGSVLCVFNQSRTKADAGDVTGAVAALRGLADSENRTQPSGLRSWLFLVSAEMLSDARGPPADDAWRQAFESAEKDRMIAAQLWWRRAQSSERRGELRDAMAHYQQVSERSGQGTDLLAARSLVRLARLARIRGDLAGAFRYIQRGRRIQNAVAPDSSEAARGLTELALIVTRKGNLVKAEGLFRRSLAMQERDAPASVDVAEDLNGLGVIFLRRDNLVKAREYFARALAVGDLLGTGPGSAPESRMVVADSLARLGVVAGDQNDFSLAKSYFDRALGIHLELSPLGIEIVSDYSGMGGAALRQGDFAAAREFYEKAVAIGGKLAPEGPDVAMSLNNLGLAFANRGDLIQAEKYCRQALSLYQKMGLNGSTGSLLNSLGWFAWYRGDLNGAEEYDRRALKLNQRVTPFSLASAWDLVNLGDIERRRGRLAEADIDYRRALAMNRRAAAARPIVGWNLFRLGDLARARGQSSVAEKYLREALAAHLRWAPQTPETAELLNYLGRLDLERGNLDEAENRFNASLNITARLSPGSDSHADSLVSLARVMRRRKQWESAERFFAEAITALETQTNRLGGDQSIRADYRAAHSAYYQDYIDLLVDRHQPELAFQILERSRARTLLESLGQDRDAIDKDADPALMGRERSLKQLLSVKSLQRARLLDGRHTRLAAALDNEIEKLLVRYQEVESQLSGNVAGPPRLRSQPLSVHEVQAQLLDADTVLLEYSLGKERSFVWVVTSNTLTVCPLPAAPEIESTALRVYRALISIAPEPGAGGRRGPRSSGAEFAGAAARLSRMILLPVAAQIAHKRLLIVSDGALKYVPFAALPEPSPAEGATMIGASGPYRQPRARPLMMGHEVVNLPSASVLALIRSQVHERRSVARDVLVLADPVFDLSDDRLGGVARRSRSVGPPQTSRWLPSAFKIRAAQQGSLSRLPFTRREAAAISAAVGASNVETVLGFEASKATVNSPRLKDYRILHLATHGVFNSRHPELSGLVFSLVDRQGRPQDGFLNLLDIYHLKLNSDLVVLSACQTAIGKQVRGEGMVGLTQGFMYAGSSRILASLWNVDDEATAELMGKFYEGMLKDRQTPAASLRSAQMWMREQKRWSAPYYWAGFVLQGEWR